MITYRAQAVLLDMQARAEPMPDDQDEWLLGYRAQHDPLPHLQNHISAPARDGAWRAADGRRGGRQVAHVALHNQCPASGCLNEALCRLAKARVGSGTDGVLALQLHRISLSLKISSVTLNGGSLGPLGIGTGSSAGGSSIGAGSSGSCPGGI